MGITNSEKRSRSSPDRVIGGCDVDKDAFRNECRSSRHRERVLHVAVIDLLSWLLGAPPRLCSSAFLQFTSADCVTRSNVGASGVLRDPSMLLV